MPYAVYITTAVVESNVQGYIQNVVCGNDTVRPSILFRIMPTIMQIL